MTKIYLCLNKDDIIVDIMVTDYEMIHDCRIPWPVADYTQKGNKYNRDTQLIEEVVPTPPCVFSKLEFREKFTLAELTGMYNAVDTDVVVKIIIDDLKISDEIDTCHPALLNGIGYLYQAGYLTYERMMEILG